MAQIYLFPEQASKNRLLIVYNLNNIYSSSRKEKISYDENAEIVRVRFKDIPGSKFKCLAKGTRRAYCQGVNVCISRKQGLFLIDNDNDNERRSRISSKHLQHYRLEHLEDPLAVDYEIYSDVLAFNSSHEAANLVMAELRDSVFYQPPIARLQRFKVSPFSAGDNRAIPDLMAITDDTPVTWHRANSTLVVSNTYSAAHYSHLLYNSIIPIWSLIRGKSLQNLKIFHNSGGECFATEDRNACREETFSRKVNKRMTPHHDYFEEIEENVTHREIIVTNPHHYDQAILDQQQLELDPKDQLFFDSFQDGPLVFLLGAPERPSNVLSSALSLLPGDLMLSRGNGDKSFQPRWRNDENWLEVYSLQGNESSSSGSSIESLREGNEIHCFERASFGQAGVCGFDCPEPASPIGVREMVKYARSTLLQADKIKDPAEYLSPFILSQSIIEFKREGGGQMSSNKWINVTLIQRTGRKRSFLNAREIFHKLEHYFSHKLANENQISGCHLRMVTLDQITPPPNHQSPKDNHQNTFLFSQPKQLISPELSHQVLLMSVTNLLIAAHGNALGNFIFLPDNSALIEINPPGFESNFYPEIVAKLRESSPVRRHTRIQGREGKRVVKRGRDESKDDNSAMNVNFDIDWELLSEALDESIEVMLSMR